MEVVGWLQVSANALILALFMREVYLLRTWRHKFVEEDWVALQLRVERHEGRLNALEDK